MTTNPIDEAANRAVALEHELESAGIVTTETDELTAMRETLHGWVDTVVGVVSSPGSGRVMLIHANGNQTKIASPELPYLLSKPVSFET